MQLSPFPRPPPGAGAAPSPHTAGPRRGWPPFAAPSSLLPPAARAFPACEPLEARFNDLECARLAVLKRLLRAPAPDLAALSLKLDLAIDDQAWELTGAEPCLAALKADARRLPGNT